MKNNKHIKEYMNKYKDIPNNYKDRLRYIMNSLQIKDKDIKNIKERIKYILGINKKSISFVFYFLPKATPRPRYSRFNKSFYVKNAIDYNSVFKEFIEKHTNIDLKITTPCELYCKTFSPIPSSMNKIESILAELGLIKHISKPDGDNLLKSYSDMIQKTLVIDDSLFYKMSIEKYYSFKPRIEITVKYMTEFDSAYNKNKISKYKELKYDIQVNKK